MLSGKQCPLESSRIVRVEERVLHKGCGLTHCALQLTGTMGMWWLHVLNDHNIQCLWHLSWTFQKPYSSKHHLYESYKSTVLEGYLLRVLDCPSWKRPWFCFPEKSRAIRWWTVIDVWKFNGHLMPHDIMVGLCGGAAWNSVSHMLHDPQFKNAWSLHYPCGI